MAIESVMTGLGLRRPPNPADAARPYLEEVPGIAHEYLDPYAEMGQRVTPRLEEEFGQLMNRPEDLINRLSEGYRGSPAFNYQMQNAMRGINTAGAMGGMLGTPTHQLQAGQMAGDIASQDFNQYLQQAMNLYGMGLQGETGLGQMGYGAAGDLTGILTRNLMSQAGLEFQGSAQQTQSQADALSNLINMGGRAAGMAGGGQSPAPIVDHSTMFL